MRDTRSPLSFGELTLGSTRALKSSASFLAGLIFRTVLRAKYADKGTADVLVRAGNLKWTLEYPGALNSRDSTRYAATVLEAVTKLPIIPSTSPISSSSQ